MIKDRDSWETPQKLWNELNKQYSFNIDCCANELNSKTKRYFINFSDSGHIGINFICWMNPPFSKAYEMFKHFFKVVFKGVAIYRCDNIETKVWQEIIFKNANWIFIFDKRINYEGQENKGARFPSALIGFNVPVPKGLNGKLIHV